LLKKLRVMAMTADTDTMMQKNCPSFDTWLESLSREPVEGLAEECWVAAKAWSSGSGRKNAAERMQAAVDELGSDTPQALAEAMYHNIANGCIYPFEASVLTMHIIDESLKECGYRKAI